MVTTIQIEEGLKSKLDKLKIHHRETYNEVITRIVGSFLPRNVDVESLTETIEVLSNPETMRDIAEALEDYKRGKFVELK